MNPRSGFFPRHRALIALSCSTSRRRGLRLRDQLEPVACGRPDAPPRAGLAPRAFQRERAAVDDRLVAQVERREPAGGVERHARPRGRRAAPGSSRARRTCRGTRRAPRRPTPGAPIGSPDDQRVAADVGVGEERLAVGGEEEALVVAQREVGERVPAVGVHQPRRRAPSRPRCAGRAADQRPEQQHQQARPGPTTPSASSAAGKNAAKNRRPYVYGPVEPDQAAERPSQSARPGVRSGSSRSRSSPQRDDAEREHGGEVERDEPDAGAAATAGRPARGSRCAVDDSSATSMPTQITAGHRVRALEQVRDGAEREERRPPPARPAACACASWSASSSSSRPTHDRDDVAGDRHPQRVEVASVSADPRVHDREQASAAAARPASAVSAAIDA